MKKILLSLITFVVFIFICVNSNANPFLNKSSSQVDRDGGVNKVEKIQGAEKVKTIKKSNYTKVNKEKRVQKKPSLIKVGINKMIKFSLKAQRKLSSHINKRINIIQKGQDFLSVFVVLFFGFVYGAVHALGPGHGKIIISSYFLSRDSKVKDGIMMGLSTAFTHGLSSIVFVSILDLTIRSFVGQDDRMFYMQRVSYVFIMLIGGYLLLRTLMENVKRFKKIALPGSSVDTDNKNNTEKNDKVAHCHCGHHSHSHGFSLKGFKENKSMYVLSFITGMVPCTGSMLIMLYTMSKGVLWLGILTVLSISLGIAITLIGFGIVSILSRKIMTKNKLLNQKRMNVLEYCARYVGASMIFVIGLIFFMGAR